MSDIDCDDHDIHHAMRRATRIRWQNSRTVPYVAHDCDDCAPELETGPDRFVAGIGCWDHDRDRSPWIPCHGGGAVLTVGGVVVVEIEPIGPGWWIGAGWAGSDGFNGTLGEAKVRALEMLDESGQQASPWLGLPCVRDRWGCTQCEANGEGVEP